MDRLNVEDFESLIDKQAGWCVSIYLPSHRSLPEARQDPIRLKNLLREAEKHLAAGGLRQFETEEFLKPAQDLLDDSLFWKHQADGLALFLSPGEFRNYRLPISFSELAVVSDRFHVKPLLPLLSVNDRFFILALSQNKVRLIEATRYGASEIELEDVPENLKEILGGFDPEKQLQFHTGAPQTGGKRDAVFHGHGGGDDDLKARMTDYFRRIDAGVHELLKNEDAPLVLAGVESHFPIYREVNSYDELLDEGITGNPDDIGVEKLRNRAWEIVEPELLRKRRETEDAYHARAGTGRTSNDLKEVLVAAYDGRIEALFVPVGSQVWGDFDEESRTVVVHEKQGAGDRDLLDVCAVRALMNRGRVYGVKPQEVPGGGQVAAIFRY